MPDLLQDISISIALLATLVSSTQVILSRRAAHGQLLRNVLEALNTTEIREGRAKLYDLAQKPLADWTEDEYLLAERVGGVYDQAGFLMQKRFISRGALGVWGVSIVNCYKIMEPLILRRRQVENNSNIFLHFEWLARSSLRKSGAQEHRTLRIVERLRRRTSNEMLEHDVTGVVSSRPTLQREL